MKQSKILLSLLTALLFIISIAGCGQIKDSEKAASTKTEMSADVTQTQQATTKEEIKDVKLTLILAQTSVKEFLKQINKNFESINPGVTIDVQAIPDDQLLDLVKTKIATGDVPDLFKIHTPALKLMNPAENFEEFSENEPWVSRLVNSNMISDLKIEGKMFGPPTDGIGGSGWGYLFNKELFQKYGINPPDNYNELLGVCEVFKKNGITPIFSADKEQWIPQIWFSIMAPQVVQADIFNQIIENKLKWSDVKEFEDAFQKQLDLYKKGYVNKDHLSATYDNLIKAMAESKAAMSFMGGWAIPETEVINPDAGKIIGKGALPCVNNPSVDAGGGATIMAVFKKALNKDIAIKYALFFTEPDSHLMIIKDLKVLSAFKDVENKDLPIYELEAYEKYIKTGRTVVDMNTQYPIDFSALWPLEQDMIADGKTPKQVLEAWDKEFAVQMKSKKMPGW